MYRLRMRMVLIITGMVILSLLVAGFAPAAGNLNDSKKPAAKNIIVMIADGRGFNHLQAASFYAFGKPDWEVYTRFPFKLAMSTYEAYPTTSPCYGRGYDPQLAWADFQYVKECYTDSAAAATAMATGVKTLDGVIGLDANLQQVPNIIEVAEQKGKSTGVITTVAYDHATPAGFVAHNVSRNNYLALGTEMIDVSAVDVLMGAGHPFFTDDNTSRSAKYQYISKTDWDALVAGTAGGDSDGDGVADPWTLIQTRAEFQSLESGPTPERLFGMAPVASTLQQARSGDAFALPFVVPFNAGVPTLEEMTKASLNVLDNNPEGFFLMVEGGAVDYAAHSNQSGRMIEEHLDFDAAVQAAIDWVQANSNWGETLLIVTDDHETGYLWGPGSNPDWNPLVNNGQGSLPGMAWFSTEHTNSLVPVFAKGDAGRMLSRFAVNQDPVRGPYLDNTDLGKLLFWTLEP